MSKQESIEEPQTCQDRSEDESAADHCEACGKKRARFVFQRSEEVFDLIGEEYVEQLWVVRHEERRCSECASERAGATLGSDDDEYDWFYDENREADDE